MKQLFLTLAIAMFGYGLHAQSQITTTGNNVIDTSNPYVADIVIGSDASGGIRHNSSIMWWSSGSASRISNTNDVFYYSVWNTTAPNIALGATVGASSYFQGNVGIGVTSPTYLLDVGSGSVNNSLRLNSVGTSGYGFFVQNGGANNIFSLTRQDGVNTADLSISAYGGIGLTGGITSVTSPAATSGYQLYLASNGNVGIGTTSIPSAYKLAVNGAAIATSVVVKLYADWPDYVFKSTYHLPLLTTVKAYIDRNKHLPEMPSEQQVKDNGINLGEIVKVQTKKIEELTLYLIDKDKQLSDQQKEIEQLKQKEDARIAVLEAVVAKLTANK